MPNVAAARALALTHGVWRQHELRSLLRTPTQQNQHKFVQARPRIRDLSHYQALVPNGFASENNKPNEKHMDHQHLCER